MLWAALALSIILTGIVGWQLDAQGIEFGDVLWLLLVGFTLYTPVSVYWGYRLLFGPITVPPPDSIPRLTEELRNTRLNFCAVSSKQVALWQSPTFLFYLMLNVIKSLLQYAKRIGVPLIEISTQTAEKESFHAEGLEIMQTLATGDKVDSFFSLRLLIYPRYMYVLRRSFIESLIHAHTLGRIHCVPVIKEKLVQGLDDSERAQIRGFAKKVGQRRGIVSALFAPIRLFIPERLDLPIPDFLIVDDSHASDVDPTERIKSNVWWYEGKTPKDDGRQLYEAHQTFSLLCKAAIESDAIWERYTAQEIDMLAAADPDARRKQFFSQDFFTKWLQQSKDAGTEIGTWLEKEDSFLEQTIQAGSSVLDVGCGFGRHMELAITRCQCSFVAGIDDNPSMVQKALDLRDSYGDKVVVFLRDATRLPWAAGTFDYVISMTNTFGNMPTAIRHRVLAEMARVLKPDGKIILSVYADVKGLMTARSESYKKVGLHPRERAKVISTDEGLESEQFEISDFARLLTDTGLKGTPKTLDRIGWICVAAKR